MPRSSRDVLMAILGDYWYRCTAPLPSAALVALLAEHGVSNSGARSALNRVYREGGLVASRTGRHTSYALSSQAQAAADQFAWRFFAFGADWPPPWDGRWTCVAFSLPGDVNRSGPVVRSRLRNLGFAQLFDGFWISPLDWADRLSRAFADLGVVDSTIFRADLAGLAQPGRRPIEAWDLTTIRTGLRAFIKRTDQLARRFERPQARRADSLTARTFLVMDWGDLIRGHPALPIEVLPDDWPLLAAHEAFTRTYDQLGPLAEARARDVLAPYDLDDDAQPTHHTAAILPGRQHRRQG